VIKIKIVYGPVSSWRLGRSLGIDLICSKEKICTFNCIYCQLGNQSKKIIKRKNYSSIEQMKLELIKALNATTPNVITFSGTGEPTLANNMDLAIKTIRNITNIPIAVLTNSTLMNIEDIRKILSKIDIVVAKLDASNERIFQMINQPIENINFKETIDGIREFRKIFKGKLGLQIMFMDKNIKYANEIATISKNIKPDEVQINTPLRISPVEPITEKQLDRIEKKFKDMGLKTISVYKSNKPKITPLDKKELIKRRKNEI
jgi:wyosine [tRNA(Phe)-imidazoG37] synthetase (radical SAM superfamily)